LARSSVARSVLVLHWIAVLVILAVSLAFAVTAWRDLIRARQVVEFVTLDRTLFDSTAGIRLEIGTVGVALLRDEDPRAGLEQGLGTMTAAHRRASEALAASDLPDRDELVARLGHAVADFDAVRDRVDAEAALPLAARDTNRIEPWRQAVYRLAATVDSTSISVGRALRSLDLELGELAAIRQMSFTIRDRYSRQCSAFRPAVQSDTPLTPAERDSWREDIGAYSALWTQMERIARQLPEGMGFAPLVAEGQRRTEAAQAIMTRTIEGLSGSGKPAFDAAAWSENCISAYSSILGIGSHALDLEARQAEDSRAEAFLTGAISTGVLVLVVVLGCISLRFVRNRLSAPMHDIEAALAKLRTGDLETPIRLPPWNDEPSAIMRALEDFRLEALETRRMRLRIDAMRDQLVEHAEKIGRAKSQFLATMSHEIRTPLHGILGTAQLLAGSQVTAEQRAWVQALDGSGRLLRDILDDILDFTRLESGRVTVEVAPFSLRERIAMVEATIRPAMERKSLDFTVAVAPDLPDALVGDAGKLGQILLNLLGNAAKFTPHGRVRLAVDADPERSDRLRFTIADTGIGIAPQALAHIFEPFSQADGSVARRFGGSGLGLAVCRGLLDVLGGSIDLTTEPGRGTTFTVLFPVREAAAPSAATADVEDEEALPPLAVLVAEDNPVNALIVRTMLERDGHTVRHVETGSAAVAVAGEEDFDVVLMDLSMPELDGAEACRLIRAGGHATRSVVPILAVSAGGSSAADVDAGFDGRLEKPFDADELRAALAEAVGMRPRRRESRRERLGAIGEQARDLGVEGARRLVELYLSSQPAILAEAVAAARHGDRSRARALAHRLKGAAAHVGADDMAAAAAALEHATGQEDVAALRAAALALETLGHTHFHAFAGHADAELGRFGADQATFSAKT
jgi:signal transduction histidine kinase/CheY-like chemotaxis protein/HPt (histidine-containing phosphotransfer) domain-containing protein